MAPLRNYCLGGTQFTSSEMRQFLSDLAIHNRVSSTAFPHDNYKAELAVKTAKMLLTHNVDSNGSLRIDNFKRTMLQYRNALIQSARYLRRKVCSAKR